MAEQDERHRVNIVLDDDQAFQKYMAEIASKRREVLFDTLGEVQVGYINSIDRKWVRITRSKDFFPVMIRQTSIITIEETGGSVDDLPEEVRRRVKRYTSLLSDISTKELNRSEDEK